MSEATRRLSEIAEQLNRGEKPEPETVRTLLSWFGAQRRGHYVAQTVRKFLRRHRLVTKPDFQYAYIDSDVRFELAPEDEITKTIGIPIESTAPTLPPELEPTVEVESMRAVVTGAIEDPTYRI